VRDTFRDGKSERKVYRVRWEKDRDQAVLTSQIERKGVQLTVSRGDFEEEIYRVR
jgi:hypothetical protein